ncbi:toll/interleukin-1 receptor domain-containing protein [candidate division KSB1 bacterium]|nr:toll/interleukin-1 receptor domain-containing protein [candidate division KSB1 bacterium]
MSLRVFISHSSMDKNRFVIPFAEKLRASGIHAWVDLWEIKPGDSLVRKIFDDGLSQSDAIIVVVSEHIDISIWLNYNCSQFPVFRVLRTSSN